VKEDNMNRAYITNGEKRNVYRILMGKPEGNSHQEDVTVGKKIIRTWIIKK
jgi:hypothetical protein